MGGKGEQGEQKLRATQDQLRIARITQDATSIEDDRINIQKLIKKVMETTRCTIGQAEIALFDADNNVEEAVNAILEDAYTDANVWKEQRSRKSKKQENEEKNDDVLTNHRNNRSHNSRGVNNFPGAHGSGRSRGSDRGRGGYRGVRGARGGYNGRGGHQTSGGRFGGNSGGLNNVWDNSQANKTTQSKEWTNPTLPIVDDAPEDTDWESAGTLVFSRREEVPSSVSPPTSTASVINSVPTCTVSAPISFAAVAAAGANKAKENLNNAAVAQNKNSAPSGATASLPPATSSPQVDGVGQSAMETYNSIYQNSDVVSTSGQLVTAPTVTSNETERSEENNGDLSNTAAPLPSSRNSSVRNSQAIASVSSVSSGGNSSSDWTAQLKNDLGIGTNPTPKLTSAVTKSVSSNKPMQPSLQKSSQSSSSHQPSYSVEFVSGEPNDSSSLPEYQFGFHVDANSNTEDSNEETFVTKSRSKNDSDMMAGDSTSILTNGGSSELTSAISTQQQAKVSASNNGVGITQPAAAVHSSSNIQRQAATSGLSLADTSSMSYPSPESRSSIAKPPLSLHQQQQTQHPLYTTTQFPYSSYPYMNMYSPVTGVRQDEAPYATLVQYPFASMGQIDMTSLSTMLPPLAPQQQPNQPPPPVQQSQHQQRPDQHGSYVDLKAYATGAGVAISSAAGGTNSGLLSNQQQPQRADTSVTSSAVAPPPGFSGPPSNIPTAAFTLPQPNHLSSLFQMPPTYHPQLNQLPFSFMLPSVTGNGQHKLGHQIFAQQTVDDNLSEQRISSQQQKVYGGGHQQIDKYGSSGGNKDRLGGGAQATPPPQIYQGQAPQGYLSQQVSHHAHNKKSYTTPQHWGAS